ncbi:IclR family transcriptional regulator [Compostimonas suwonensis]|uniref:Glycerol operon regulatory protein n=1 Tax=Compostimonas suwonensis TaxID=1048394 RepID=A0A2M9BWT1_9MICO|nr:IclR family transcriptional regulator [Compostimonas suwonensis]PJJ62399.1 IclR family acetate operon transcriptional repressor [Compostimonas suwonensis]
MRNDENTSTAPADRGRPVVQSVERAFGLLELLADHGGVMSISQMAHESRLPLPTIHRLVRTLVEIGYLRQEPSRQYVLGPRLIRLGESSAKMLTVFATSHLERVVEQVGESANLAMLDGDRIIYIAQAHSKQSMRMFTEVGRRVRPHCTAVGKAIMAGMPAEEVAQLLRRTGMPRETENTITDPDVLLGQLDRVRELGYAVDDGEQEVGVHCVAVVVPNAPARLALSVSGPATRMTVSAVARAVPVLMAAGQALSADLM